MSRRREQKSRPEKKPPGRFLRLGPHWLDGRSAPPDMWVVLSERLTSPEAKDQLRVRHPFLLGFELFDGTLGAQEAAALACRYLSEAEAKFAALMKRASEQPASGKLPINGVPLGTEGRYCMAFARYLLAALPPEAAVLAALAFAAGFDTGRLHEAELQAADILTGDKVRRGGEKSAAITNATRVPTEERLEAWRTELARRRRPDGTLPHGAIAAVARTLAERHGTLAEAERRFAYDHRDALGF